MKNIFLFIVTSFLLMVANGEQYQPETANPRIIIDFEKLNTSEFDISKEQYYELMKEVSYFDYDLKNTLWSFEEIHCSLIKNAHIVKGKSTELHSSEFTVLFFQNSKRINIIPLSHNSLRSFSDPYHDPHNWAYFSEIIEGEEIKDDNDENWLSLAVCFVGMVMIDEMPNLVTKDNINNILGNDVQNILQLLPRVERSKSMIEVSFYHKNRYSEGFLEWHFGFKKKGLLTYVSKEPLTKTDILEKLEGIEDELEQSTDIK